jgi:hypothetical protein
LVSVEEAASSLAGEDGSGADPEAPSLISFLLDRPRQPTLASKLQTVFQQSTKNTPIICPQYCIILNIGRIFFTFFFVEKLRCILNSRNSSPVCKLSME